MDEPVEELERIWELCQLIDLGPDGARLECDLLEPAACLLGAETAIFRVFSLGAPKPAVIVGLGIRDAVHDAYLNRYFMLDPTRRLMTRRFAKPVFADRKRPGQWLDEHVATTRSDLGCTSTALMLAQHQQEFCRYQKEFLLPNNLCHHLGFRFQDASGHRTFLLDFHRARKSTPFRRLEFARARIIAMLLQAKASQYEQDPAVNVDDGRLSTRELEVAETVALGLTNKEVGDALSISVRTVENHMRSIFAKLEINTRTRLAARLHEMDRARSR